MAEAPSTAPSATRSTGGGNGAGTGTTAGQVTAESLAACITELTGTPGVVPLVVDHGSYEGKPADIVVLPSTPAGYVDVWIIGPGCTSGNVQVYEFAHVKAG